MVRFSPPKVATGLLVLSLSISLLPAASVPREPSPDRGLAEAVPRKDDRQTGVRSYGNGATRVAIDADAVGSRSDRIVRSSASGQTSRGGGTIKLSGTPIVGHVVAFDVSSDGTRAVYIADQAVNDDFNLYSVPVDGSSSWIKLNGALVANAFGVNTFQITPDGTRVIYRSDEDNTGVFELHSVPITGPASAGVVISSGGIVDSFGISPDSSRVAYLQGGANADVFTVPTTGGTIVQLSDSTSVHGGGNVPGPVIFSPDSSRLAYSSDELVDQTFDLFSVPVDGPIGSRVQLNPAMAAFRIVDLYDFSPDSSRVVYMSDENAAGVFDVFSIAAAGPQGTALMLNTAMPGGALGAADFFISSDSARVVYRADETTAGVDELYSAPINVASTPIKLNRTMTAGGDLLRENISPDGTRVTYVADQDSDEVFELYGAPIDVATSSIKLHAVAPGDNVGVFTGRGTPIMGNRAVYPVFDSMGVAELYSVPIDGTQPFTRLNTPLPLNATLSSAVFPANSDAKLVPYAGEQNAVGLIEAFAVPVIGSLAPSPINGPLVIPEAVVDYKINSTEEYALYTADETAPNVELYSRAIDSDQDGAVNGNDNCMMASNPAQFGAVFGQTIVAEDKSTFTWPNSRDVTHVYGPLDNVGNYATNGSGTKLDAVSYVEGTIPGPGLGLYYLVTHDCAGRSWQTVLGNEANRDVFLP